MQGAPRPRGKITVLVVDDSAVMRKILVELLSSDPNIEVVGTAPDPIVARDKLVKLKPDVMTLDIEMPRMDGITFLGKVMQHMPTRTIIVSSLSQAGSEMAFKALEAGAVDVIAKPTIDLSIGMEALAADLTERVKTVATSQLVGGPKQPAVTKPLSIHTPLSMAVTTHKILALAASTGGTEALKAVLTKLPPNCPGTVIVQHMPPFFTKTYAENLNRVCQFEVREARDGDRVMPGLALLAPGNYHMELVRKGAFYYVSLNQAPQLHGVRPAADYLLRSVAQHAGANAVGVVLTGMGKDGAEGLLAMRKAGGGTIAQDESTSVVYGMPKVAYELGAVETVLPLDKVAAGILAKLNEKL